MVKHSLVDVDINDSSVWHEDRGLLTATFRVTVMEGNGFLYSAKLTKPDSTEVVLAEKGTDEIRQSNISVLIDRSLVVTGENTITLTVYDVVDGVEGESTNYDFIITGENRDSFTIKRDILYRSEWMTYGNMSLNFTDGATVKTENAKGLSGIIVNKIPINMDGRSSVLKITVDADPDIKGDSARNYQYDTYSDRGDNIVTTYDLGNLKLFNNIKSLRSK